MRKDREGLEACRQTVRAEQALPHHCVPEAWCHLVSCLLGIIATNRKQRKMFSLHGSSQGLFKMARDS